MNKDNLKNLFKNRVLLRLLFFVFLSITLSYILRVLSINGYISWNLGYSDVGHFYYVVKHLVPYISVNIEYPSLIGIVIYFASRFDLVYHMLFHYAIFLVCALISTIYLSKLSEKLKTPHKNLVIFWACSITFLLFSFYNWDIIAVMFSILALFYYKERKDIIATIFVGLGCATKLYPVLFLLPVLLNRKFIDWLKIFAIFITTFVLVNIYFVLKNFQGWFYFYQFNNARSPNLDSIWGIIYRLFPKFSISSINLTTLILLASSYFILCIFFRKKDFILLSFAATILFILFNKVFSPQYILWLLPFIALYGIPISQFMLLELSNLIVLYLALTYILITGITELLYLLDIFVCIRFIALILVLVITIMKLTKSKNVETEENYVNI
jgi:uncharacterized membrane protein